MTAAGRILVLGGSGKLGTALVRELESRGVPVVEPPPSEVDLLSSGLDAVVERWSPMAVINAAAYNDVDGAESEANRTEAFRLNRDAPAELARTCAERQVPLVHVSTDYVFDGTGNEPYREDDPARPLQVYGRSKLEGERSVMAAHAGAIVARTSTLFGTDRLGGSNFVRAILTRARTVSVLHVVRLPVSSPTYATDLARALLALLDAGARGLVHVANAGSCTRFELAAEAIRLAGLDDRVELREPSRVPTGAPRPAYSALSTQRYEEITGQAMRPWQEALADYVRAI